MGTTDRCCFRLQRSGIPSIRAMVVTQSSIPATLGAGNIPNAEREPSGAPHTRQPSPS